jgi:hypothetical protein
MERVAGPRQPCNGCIEFPKFISNVIQSNGAASYSAKELFNPKMLNPIMKTRLLVLPLIFAAVLLAQPPGGNFRRGQAKGTPPAPPTADQLAARELQMVSNFLGLDSAQTSALTGNTALVAQLTANQISIQGYRATLKSDFAAVATSVAGKTAPASNITTDIGNQTANIVTAHANGAILILNALEQLNPALTPAQQTRLANLVKMLSNGGAGGMGFGRGRL